MASFHSNENPCTDFTNQVVSGGKRLRSFLRNFIIPTRLPLPLHKELPNDMRGVILVAVALIAAATFQAGVAPPGGVWQDSDNGHVPGRAVYASQPVPFYFFLICNTMAFSSSIYLLLYLTFGKPFFLEVLVATLSMCGTYAAAVFSITPYETGTFRLIGLVAALPLALRLAIYLLCWMITKLSCKGCKLCNENAKESDAKESSSGSCPICQLCEKHAKGSNYDVYRRSTLHQSA